jgi:hypothetical protein
MDSNQQQTQAVDGAALAWAFRKFVAAFPASFPDEDAIEQKVELWRELLEQHPSVTKPVFATAVYAIAWTHKEDFLPTPAKALEFFRAAQADAQRDAAALLPPPSAQDGEGDGSWFKRTPWPEVWAVFARHYVIGKARQRKRNALIDAYKRANGIPSWCGVPESCWKGLDEPTEAEQAAVRAECERKDWWKRAQLPPELKILERTGGAK